MEFQRFTAPDPAALEASISDKCAGLAAAQQAGDELAIVDHTADLGALLTTARREAEALPLMQAQLDRVEAFSSAEVAGWFWNAYATALQYNGRRDEADPAFAKALALSRAGGWLRLQSFVLQHWGRSLVEQGRLDDAQARFEEALAIRQQLDDPRTASTEAALAGLAELREQQAAALRQGSCHCGAVRLTLPALPDKATKCNCSICRRINGLWALLRVRHGEGGGPPGAHGRIHLGRQDTAQHSLHPLRLLDALGALGPGGRRPARREPEQLRPAAS